MNERGLAYIVVGSVCFVFVGSFVASLFIKDYSGASAFAPVMTGVAGAVLGTMLASKKKGGDEK